MGMFPSPFLPIAASPPTDGRDRLLGHRRTVRGRFPSQANTPFSGPSCAAVRREGELADHAAVDRWAATGAALRRITMRAGRSGGAGARRPRLARSLNRLRG
jgi:hypothetical protein